MGVVAENGMTITVATAAQLPQGIRARSVYSKVCDGVTAEAMEWHCQGSSQFDLTCDRYRLGVVLEQTGGKCETRANPRISHRYPTRGMPFANLVDADHASMGVQRWHSFHAVVIARVRPRRALAVARRGDHGARLHTAVELHAGAPWRAGGDVGRRVSHAGAVRRLVC